MNNFYNEVDPSVAPRNLKGVFKQTGDITAAGDGKITFAQFALESGHRQEYISSFMVQYKIPPDFRSTAEKFEAAMQKWLKKPIAQDFLQ